MDERWLGCRALLREIWDIWLGLGMCGIAGIFNSRGGGDADRRLLRCMTNILAHRGPDGDGFYFAPGDRAGASPAGHH